MRISRVAMIAVLLLTRLAVLHADEMQVVVPQEDAEVVLHNPDMGWVLYENHPIDPRANGTATMDVLPQAEFEGCDGVAVMFAWSDVEKEEGRFDWKSVDEAWDYWMQRGKSIQLRLSTEPLFGWCRLKPPGGLGIPDWLLGRIPEAQKKRREDGAMFGWHVDARNALYQERLGVFLKEVNSHFTGKRCPALVDLRGFGRWGEWHSGYPYASLEDKRAALRIVLDTWCEALGQHRLAISYSYDPDGPEALHAGPHNKLDPAYVQNYDEYLRWSAFDLAMKKPNITLRRDGAGGAVCSNERKLCEYAYRELRRGPQMSEFVTGYGNVRKGGPAWVKWIVDDALSLHPNYIGLLGYGGRDALAFMRERPDLVGHGLRKMGYRLVPLKVTFPTAVKAGEKFILKTEWTNRAAGRALRDYVLRVRLVNDKGETLAQAEAGALPTSQWLQGETHAISTEVLFPKIKETGKATLLISLFDPASGRAIALPLWQRVRDEFCKMGEVLVGP